MKNFLSIVFLFLSLTAMAQIESVIPAVPNPPRLVNDFSGDFITSEQRQMLEDKLVAYDDSTSNQIAIVIVNDLGGYPIDEYAVALGRKWGVGGQKQFNNGVVILVNAAKTGGKRGVFIATGYGIEGAVSDLIAGEIVQNNLLPNFRAGNNYQGLDEAVDNIINAAAGRYTAPEDYHQTGKGPNLFTVLILIAIVFFVLLVLSNKGGNGGGGYVSRRGYTDPWARRSSGGGWIIPGGGGWSGGGSSGGGGGFGGFGGGSFGGGGAGGSW
ncbi:MAG: TPM domain-containing protein [Niabella sp.]